MQQERKDTYSSFWLCTATVGNKGPFMSFKTVPTIALFLLLAALIGNTQIQLLQSTLGNILILGRGMLRIWNISIPFCFVSYIGKMDMLSYVKKNSCEA